MRHHVTWHVTCPARCDAVACVLGGEWRMENVVGLLLAAQRWSGRRRQSGATGLPAQPPHPRMTSAGFHDIGGVDAAEQVTGFGGSPAPFLKNWGAEDRSAPTTVHLLIATDSFSFRNLSNALKSHLTQIFCKPGTQTKEGFSFLNCFRSIPSMHFQMQSIC